ncbi:hypothetical protein V1VFAS_135 [Rhizobium phage V1VFA-S]|nr:hypothetical protein V1VFAS_135 [Rhizobium phage V1VFA-S]
MTEEELEKRGAAFFDKLHPDDKKALKWFLTGQIQNILANEHGIGGSKGVREAVREMANSRVNSLINDQAFQEKLAERLASKSRINFTKLIEKAAETEAQKAIEKAAGYAARRVKIKVFIEPDPEEAASQAPNFGTF